MVILALISDPPVITKILQHLGLPTEPPRDVVKFVGNEVYGDGSPANPYRHIEDAITHAPDHATLIFKAGTDNTFASETLVIDRPFALKGVDVRILRQ